MSERRKPMPHLSWRSFQRSETSLRHSEKPGSGSLVEVSEDIDGERSCRPCVHLARVDGLFGCEVGILDRTYRVIASLKSPYPSEIAARCTSYSKRESRFGKEG